MVYRKLEMFAHYPEQARDEKIEGTAIVQFKITPTGEVKNIKAVKSSGHKILDRQVIDQINASVPFPPPPARFFTDGVTIAFPANFTL